MDFESPQEMGCKDGNQAVPPFLNKMSSRKLKKKKKRKNKEKKKKEEKGTEKDFLLSIIFLSSS